MGMVSVPVDAGAASSAAGSAAGAGAADVVAESAGLSSFGVHAASVIARIVMAMAKERARIAGLREGLEGRHYRKQSSNQLVGLEVALEVAIAVVAARVLDQVLRRAQPVLGRGGELGDGARQVFLRDGAFASRLEVLGEHVL